MATPEGHAALKKAIRQNGLTPTWEKRATRADIALRVWLVAPALLARKSNEQQFGRVGRFDHYEAVPARAEARRGPTGSAEDQAALARRLDACVRRMIGRGDGGGGTVRSERGGVGT